MLIFLKQKLAIFAMPKTGSTALEAVLAPHADIILTGDPRNKHMTVRKFDRFMRTYLASLGYDDMETACLFREPTEWLGSWYRYRQRPALFGHKNSTADVSFEQFVDGYLANPKPAFAQIGDPARFVGDRSGRLSITHLFRYEDFTKFETFLADRLGFGFTTKKLNSSPIADLTLSQSKRLDVETNMAEAYKIYHAIGGD